MTAQEWERKTLSIPKDAGYTQIPTLERLVGTEEDNFGHAVLKELLDNSLDAAESAGVAPEIEVTVGRAGESGDWLLAVADNGPGIPAETVARLRDFSASTSDKAAYRSPTRGAQGNAWPCIISIPFALRARPSKVVIEAQGVHHTIWLEKVLGGRLDSHHDTQPSERTTGTRVIIPLPAWLKLDVSRWVQDYVTMNPHAMFTVRGPAADFGAGPEIYKPAGQDGWRKWLPKNPTSPWWYDEPALRDLIGFYLAAGDDKPLGSFVREFDGLTASAKARQVAAKLPGITHLSGFKKRPEVIAVLLAAMQEQARQVKPAALGVVPREHYEAVIGRLFGIDRGRFWHARKEVPNGGIPWAVDVAVAATVHPGRVIYGTNFGVPFEDPLGKARLQGGKWYGSNGAASFLRQAGAYPDPDTNDGLRAAVVHVQCAAPRWTDPGKKALTVPAEVAEEIAAAFAKATKVLRQERERAQKDAVKEQRRQEREARAYHERRDRDEREPSLKQAVRDVLGQAADLAAGGEPLTIRVLYRQVQEAVAEVTSRELTWQNFKQILGGYERDHGEIPGLNRETAPEVAVDMSRHPRGPDELKAAAAMLGVGSYTELLALSRDNDPYAMGKPAEQKKARWFAGLAEVVSRGLEKLHIRGFHYRWFTAGGDGLDGRRYENDQEHWQEISRASKIARVLGLVDPETFEDRRNKALRVYTRPREDTAPEVTFGDEEWTPPVLDPAAAELPALDLPDPVVTGYEYDPADQPEIQVLITEKLEDVLDPVCRELGIDLLPGTGYSSYTRAIQLLRHAEARGQALRGWYVSDYDDAGENMPVAFARACQYFADQIGIKAEITLEPLALTAEQVERYRLPKAPDKKQTELDALEALHPGTLARILRDAVAARRDASLEERFEDVQREAEQVAAKTWDGVTAEVRAALALQAAAAKAVLRRRARIERKRDAKIARRTASRRRRIAEIQREINGIAAEVTATFEPKLLTAERAYGDVGSRIAESGQKVIRLMEETDFDLPERPEPEVDVDDSGVLYDSRRHWLDQLAAFKSAKGAPTPAPMDGTEQEAS